MLPPRLIVLALLAGSPLLAGCVLPVDPASSPERSTQELAPLALLPEGGFEIGVPVDVVLLGFPPETAAALSAKLAATPIEHVFFNSPTALPPDPTTGFGPADAVPVRPVAHYRVVPAPDALEAGFRAVLANAKVPDADDVYDANVVEDFLAAALPEHGIAVRADTPPFVLLHLGDEDHAWRLTFPNGWLEPVRVFGERRPLLVMDVSAREDPFVFARAGLPGAVLRVEDPTSGEPERAAYNRPLDAGPGAAGDLAEAVLDATHFRLLQGPIYPTPVAPCHAVTLILAVRATALTEALPDQKSAEEYLRAEAIESALENLTGAGRVEVDVTILRLPADDPPLEAVIPRSAETLDVFRAYMHENWDAYWVPHDGCEGYVSFLVYGDAAETRDFGGIALYDVAANRRLSFSQMNDLDRIRSAWDVPLQDLLGGPDASMPVYDRASRLFAHETGHLMGQTHPHNVGKAKREGTLGTPAFSSVWSVMSYQVSARVTDFGVVDATNHARNRAGFMVALAMEHGLESTPEFARSLEHLRAHQWRDAGDALLPVLPREHAHESP